MRRPVASVAIGVTLAAMLAGCSWLPEPPDDVVAEADAYAASVRTLPGVEAVEVDVGPLDPKDKPGLWVSHVTVDATTPAELESLPPQVHQVVPPRSSTLRLTIRFPAGESLAPVYLSGSTPGLEIVAAHLRSLPFAASVHLDGTYNWVRLTEGIGLTSTAGALRELDPWGEVASVNLIIPDGDGSVEVTAATPSDGLLELFEIMRRDADVSHLRFSAADPLTGAFLSIDTTDPHRIARSLNSFTHLGEGDDDIRFSVHSDAVSLSGCVGSKSC